MRDESFRYPGDLEMGRLLAELACPRRMAECRALLRGAVAAQKVPLPSVLVRELFDGREPHFRNLAQADRFVACLFALLGELQARFSSARWAEEELEAGPNESSGAPRTERSAVQVGTLQDRAAARYAEVRAFLRGLDLGATNPEALTEPGRAALRALTEASAYLGAMAGLALTDMPRDPTLAATTGESLANLEAMTSGAMVEIERALRSERQPDGTRVKGSGVGPSDLCDCGSGKPKRRCCGAPA